MLYVNELDEILDNESFLVESNVDVFSIEEDESDTAYIAHCLENSYE